MKKLVVSFCAFIFCTNTALAANTIVTINQAVAYLKSGSAKEAYALLKKHHDINSKNPQELFLLGISAKKSENIKEAVRYFERLLTIDPNVSRAKLELAEIAYRNGNGDKAKQLLLDVKAANPPAGVVATIDRFLANIATSDKPRRNWRVRGSLGLMHDSNANAGPDVDSVQLFGLPFLLTNDAKGTSDNALLARLSFDHVKPINNTLNWQSSLSSSWTDYRNLSNLDALYISASTGATWKQNGHMIWSLPIIADWVKIGHDNSYYSYSYGIAPQLRYLIDDKLSLSVATSLSKKKYQSSSNRDLSAWTLSPSLDYRVSEKGSMRVGVTGGEERSGLAIYSNNTLGVNASYFHNFSKDLIATVRIGYSDARYKAREAAYNETRHDKATRLGFDLVYRLASIDSELAFSVTNTSNDSNLPIYEYNRNQFSLSLRKAF